MLTNKCTTPMAGDPPGTPWMKRYVTNCHAYPCRTPPMLRHSQSRTNPGAAISANVCPMNAITLATMSSVTTERLPVVQRGIKGWMRGEPMPEKLTRRALLSNHFQRENRDFSEFIAASLKSSTPVSIPRGKRISSRHGQPPPRPGRKPWTTGPFPANLPSRFFGQWSGMGGFHILPMSHSLFTFLAQAAATGAPSAGPGGINPTPIIYVVCLFTVFYFLAIRPNSQRQKQQDAMIKAIKTGDKIVTSSGIHGLVSNVKETTIIVKIADNVKIELDKSSVGSVKRSDAEALPAA